MGLFFERRLGNPADQVEHLVGVRRKPITDPDPALVELRDKYLKEVEEAVKKDDDPDMAQIIVLMGSIWSGLTGLLAAEHTDKMADSLASPVGLAVVAPFAMTGGGITSLFRRRKRIETRIAQHTDRISFADKAELDELISSNRRLTLPCYTEEHGRYDMITWYRQEIQEHLLEERKKLGNAMKDPFTWASSMAGAIIVTYAAKTGKSLYALLAAVPILYTSTATVYKTVKQAEQIEKNMRQDDKKFSLDFLLQSSEKSQQVLYNICT